MEVGEESQRGFEDAVQLALEKEEGSQSQGRQAASESWNRQGNIVLWRGRSPDDTSVVTQRPILDFDLQNCKTTHLCCLSDRDCGNLL